MKNIIEKNTFLLYNKINKIDNNFERMIKMKITKDMTIGSILEADEGTAQFFLGMGMHCLGCPSARGESIEQACMVHGVDVDDLIDEINDYLATK